MRSIWREERSKDVLILVGCALLNLLLTLLLYPKFAYIGTDGVSYALMAKSLALGEGLMVFHHPHIFFSPLFSFTIVPFYFMIGDIDLAAHVTVIVLGLLSLPFFYFATQSFVGRRIAAIATLFLAVNGTVIWKNLRPLAQPLATFLSVVLFFLLTRYTTFDKSRPKVFALSFLLGLIAGALYLTRPEYVVLIFPLIIFVFFVNRPTVTLRRNIMIIFTTLLGFMFFATPYISFLHTETGQWTFAGRLQQQTLVAQGLSISGEGAQPLISATSDNSIAPFLKSIFSPKFIKVYLSNLYDIEWFLLRIFGIIGFSFFGIGLWRTMREKRYEIFGVLAVPTAMLFAFAMGFNGDYGYLEPYEFIFIFFIGVGCNEFVSALAIKKRTFLATGIIMISALYFAFPLFQNYFFRSADTAKPVEYQMLGQYFKESAVHPEQQVIAARKPEIAFYAGTDWAEISGKETPEQLMHIMKNAHAGYLALDTRSVGDSARMFIDSESKSPTKGLVLVKDFQYGGEEISLYRLSE